MSYNAARIRVDHTDLMIRRAIQACEKRDVNGILLDYNSLKNLRKTKFNFDKPIFLYPDFTISKNLKIIIN